MLCPPLTGSAEGFNKADKDINTAVKSGRWVASPVFSERLDLFSSPNTFGLAGG